MAYENRKFNWDLNALKHFKDKHVKEYVAQNGPAFDLSAYNAQDGVLATYADLNAALTALNALSAAYKKGGMSFKFVQSSDNKYVQYTLKTATFSIDVNDWEQKANNKDVKELLHLNKLYGKLIHIKDNIGKEIIVSGSSNYHICGKNLFDKSSIRNNKIINDGGAEIDDAFSSYSSRFIPIISKYSIKHIRSNFQIQRICLYDAEKNFIKRIGVFSDGILLYDVYNNTNVAFIQIQVSNSAISDSMMMVLDDNTISPEPSYEPFVENTSNIAYPEMYVYSDALEDINVTYLTSKITKDYLFVADENSIYAKDADVICSGIKQDEQINTAIQRSKKKKIIFACDSTFILSSPIKAFYDNMCFISKGAKFTTPNDSFFRVLSPVTQGTNIVNIGSQPAEKLSYGTYIMIKEGDVWETAYISKFGEYGTLILSKNLEHSYTTSATVRNVSSAFEARDVKNIIYKGLHIDWNYPNNVRCEETTWAQNGITIGASDSDHYGSCSNCEVSDCIIENGGRHGILVRFAKNCVIKNNKLYNWGEHCIDIAYAWTTTAPIQNHIVSNNICQGAEYNGIQLHGGSGCIIESNICFDNNSAGIGMLEYTHDNIIANNECYSNIVGIAIYNHANNIIIKGNNIHNNTGYGIYLATTSDSLVLGNDIVGNGNANSNGGGLVVNGETVDTSIVYAGRNTISSNLFKNNKGTACIYLGLCNRYLVQGNNCISDDNTIDFVKCYYSKGGKISSNFISNFRYVCNGGNWNIVNDNAIFAVTAVLNDNGQYSVDRTNDILQYID